MMLFNKNQIILFFAIFITLSGCSWHSSPNNLLAVDDALFHHIANPEASYEVSLWSRNDALIIGQNLSLFFRPMADCYLSLYGISSSGKTYQLFADVPGRVGQTTEFPGSQRRVDFKLSPPPGTESYILISTLQPLDFAKPGGITEKQMSIELFLTPKVMILGLEGKLKTMNSNEWNSAVLHLPLNWK